MKAKFLAVGLTAVIAAAGVCGAAGCNKEGDDTDANYITAAIAREAGSGTRGAFDELVVNKDGVSLEDALQQKDFAGCVSETNTTAAVITEVGNGTNRLGYISLGVVSKNADKIKPVKVEGVEATTQNIVNGSYVLSRPFNIIYQSYEGLSAVAKDFVDYILSSSGQALLEEEGYIQVSGEKQEYTVTEGLSGTVTIDGSTSVQPVMSRLAAAYMKLNPSVNISVEGGGSGVGITDAQNGTVDIGMASRALKSSETGVVAQKIADDGIAVIVHVNSTLTNVTLDQLYELYMNGTRIEAI